MRRTSLSAAAAAALLITAGSPQLAFADRGTGPGGSSTPTTIESHVELTTSSVGSGGTHLTSSGGSWVPPACWYEPAFTPDEFDAWFKAVIASLSGPYGAEAQQRYDALKADGDFHRGQPGLWWMLVKTKAAWDLPQTDPCNFNAGAIWVPPAGPPPGAPAVTPQLLSKIAYEATKLPAPAVKLSPGADQQTVNLPTFVSFAEPLPAVSVTAALDYKGLSIAASTLAVPSSLRVDAGTDDASPRTCTYQFTKTGTGYAVDSSTADCNITYRRSSRGGTYPLTAEVTWHVTWTASKDPYAAPATTLPDGLTGGTPQDVVVKEIQTIVTG